MVNKRGQRVNRIPVHFVDDEQGSSTDTSNDSETTVHAGSDQDDISPEEIARESSYEGETEVKRRIDQGQETDATPAREQADESDTAGGPPEDELPERREDQDRQASTSPSSSARDSAQPSKEENQSSATANPEAPGPMLAELIATRAELRRIEGERAELREALSRRQADYENYRKRVERDRSENYNRMVGDVVSKLLPVLDNLRRALDAEATVQESESKEFRHFLHGVELISKQLSTVLEGLGLQPVPALGELFDPHIHEAVVTEQTDEYEPDTVIQEIVPGYRLGEKLLRPAIVKVATK
jgi:molecular chaperone GrpE